MKCENMPILKFIGCRGYNPKIYIIPYGDKLKAYEADGLKLGRFIGYCKWNDNGGVYVEQQISQHP